MPNTVSAKKALRQSKTKRTQNLFWKSKVKSVRKNLDAIINNGKTDPKQVVKELSVFQKTLDKAAKNKALPKNKADRLKSRYAEKLSK